MKMYTVSVLCIYVLYINTVQLKYIAIYTRNLSLIVNFTCKLNLIIEQGKILIYGLIYT